MIALINEQDIGEKKSLQTLENVCGHCIPLTLT